MLSSSIAKPDDTGALSRYGTVHGAGSYAGKYGRSTTKRWTAARETAILRAMLARFSPDASLLDLPCGAGRFLETIAPGARRRVVFADASQSMLDAAKEALAAAGATAVELVRVDAMEDRAAARFDLVLCVRLLHHFADGAGVSNALDYLAGSATQGIICTFASASTWKGRWRRFSRGLSGRRGEVLRSDEAVEREFRARGWRLEARRRVNGLFSTQTWLLLVPHAG